MAIYEVDSRDNESEAVLLMYDAERRKVQQAASGMYFAIQQAEAAYAKFAAALGEGGRMAALAEYHVAKLGPLLAVTETLREEMGAVVARMEAMEAGYSEGQLFPGVPKGG